MCSAVGRRRTRAAWRPGGRGLCWAHTLLPPCAWASRPAAATPFGAGAERAATRRGARGLAGGAQRSFRAANAFRARRNVCKPNEFSYTETTNFCCSTHTRGRARLGGPPVCPTFSSRRLATIVDRTWRRRLRRPSKRERAHEIVSRYIASEVRRVGAGGGARRWAKWARGRSIRDGCQPRQLWRAIRARRARETLIDTPRYWRSW